MYSARHRTRAEQVWAVSQLFVALPLLCFVAASERVSSLEGHLQERTGTTAGGFLVCVLSSGAVVQSDS